MKEQLFMLHFSGGSVYSFTRMFARLKESFTMEPIELPGRGQRFEETLISNSKKAINDLLNQVMNKRNGKPFYIYGHSLGAALGLLLVKELEQMNDAPVYLIVSGNAGPNVPDDDHFHHLPKPLFLEKLRELGGLAPEILRDEEAMSIYEPILRADFQILEENVEPFTGTISTPVYAIMGDQEKDVEHILNWQQYVTGKFSHQVVPGNHFFINDHADTICDIITRCKQGAA